jgi:hypothetical protein
MSTSHEQIRTTFSMNDCCIYVYITRVVWRVCGILKPCQYNVYFIGIKAAVVGWSVIVESRVMSMTLRCI